MKTHNTNSEGVPETMDNDQSPYYLYDRRVSIGEGDLVRKAYR